MVLIVLCQCTASERSERRLIPSGHTTHLREISKAPRGFEVLTSRRWLRGHRACLKAEIQNDEPNRKLFRRLSKARLKRLHFHTSQQDHQPQPLRYHSAAKRARLETLSAATGQEHTVKVSLHRPWPDTVV